MGTKDNQVYQVLNELDIEFDKFTHEPVYTIEQAEEQLPDLMIDHCKNLFLRNNKGDRHYLIIMTKEKNANLKQLAKKIESTRLSFASERRLKEHLGLDKGAVSPFGLINDKENNVEVIVDKDIKKEEKIIFHPNVNNISVSIKSHDLAKFLDWTGNPYYYIEIN